MKIVSGVCLFFLGVICIAAEPYGFDAGSRRGFPRGGRGEERMGGNRNAMMRNRIFAEAEIAEKFPAEYAEVDKLRVEYEAKLAELAKKASVELPESRDEVFRKIRKEYPAEFAAAVKKMKTSPRDGFGELMSLAKKAGVEFFGGMRGGFSRGGGNRPAAPVSGRSFNRPDLSELRKKYPEKMKQYDELRSKDAGKARQLLLQIIQEAKGAEK
ncbi:MAG: hypothetical protein J6W00_04135 [Lentisphaeria bacterium]|nr:hypothetical protein [Lentisphaeria bacterium]